MASLPDFDQLLHLAQSDPDALDRLKRELVADALAQARPEHRPQLEALQSHVDRTLAHSKNPYHGLVQVMGMMQDKLYRLALALNDPAELTRHQAKVLPLDPARARMVNKG
ncbi:DUF3135 domain-containing protein [Ferrimonas balearica]|uniref:DUF3135 domain-containing protein n=1 Tax=Ferrimonas balearica TaxID=44012 RepID=UPI001C99B44D|nr:DUF3135 domain-containing protein [Ferrimonas balearica]MBY5991833.1 DUF3135 domain-containing protein [Ferrimonas balearica]